MGAHLVLMELGCASLRPTPPRRCSSGWGRRTECSERSDHRGTGVSTASGSTGRGVYATGHRKEYSATTEAGVPSSAAASRSERDGPPPSSAVVGTTAQHAVPFVTNQARTHSIARTTSALAYRLGLAAQLVENVNRRFPRKLLRHDVHVCLSRAPPRDATSHRPVRLPLQRAAASAAMAQMSERDIAAVVRSGQLHRAERAVNHPSVCKYRLL
jgi:hypothetical protein